jgi:hypothetical protein
VSFIVVSIHGSTEQEQEHDRPDTKKTPTTPVKHTLAAPRPNISTLAKVSSSSSAVSNGTNDDDAVSSLSLFVDDKIIVGTAGADDRHNVVLVVRAAVGVKARTDVSVANTSTASTTIAEQRILLAAAIVLAAVELVIVVVATIGFCNDTNLGKIGRELVRVIG